MAIELETAPPEPTALDAPAPQRRVLAVVFSQSGDAARCADAFLAPLTAAGAQVDRVALEASPPFPFPWRSLRRFFNVMPDCIRGVAPSIQEPAIDLQAPYDLTVLFYQVWFLSPSLPFLAFLHHPKSRVIEGRPTMTVVICRNMWTVAAKKVHRHLAELGARHIDNLVVTHQGPVWSTFISTPRYLLSGKRDRLWNVFPEPGVGAQELSRVRRFGEHLAARLHELSLDRRQPFFTGMQAAPTADKYILPEVIGSYLFRGFAALITAAGRLGGPVLRGAAVYLFMVVLVLGIVIGIPILMVVRFVCYPLLQPALRRYKSLVAAPSEPLTVDVQSGHAACQAARTESVCQGSQPS